MSSTGGNTKSTTSSLAPGPSDSTTNMSNPTPSSKQEDKGNATTSKQVDKGKATKSTDSKVSGVGKTRSWVWNHFEKIECQDKVNQKASCNYCGSTIGCPSKSGTTALSNHYNRCKKNPYNNADKKKKTLEFKNKQRGDEKFITSYVFDQERCRKSLVKMIITDELPFRFVEREGFKLFCEDLQPKVFVPSRSTVTRDCHSLFLDEKKKMKDFFSKLAYRVCLTTDSWSSIQNLNYMCLNAHFIDDNCTLQKIIIINFCPITSHAGEVIGRSVERCLLDWGIDKVLTITVDNASSNDQGLSYLKRRLNSWKGTVLNGDFLHMRCVAHILSLTIREGLKELDDAIFRIRSAVKYVRSSPARAQRFKSCINKERIESKALVCLDVGTRWSSTYLMLESAVKFQKAFELLETVDSKYVEELSPNPRAVMDGGEEHIENVSNKKTSKVRGLPTEDDWEYAHHLLPFLKIFYESTLKLSGSHYVTGNQYMLEIYAIGFLLTSLIEGNDVGVSSMAFKMKKKHDKYWANVDKLNVLLFIAAVLDPRYKLNYVFWVIDKTYDAGNAYLLKEKVKRVLTSMFDTYNITSALKVVTSQPEEVNKNEVDKSIGAVDYMNAMYFDKEDDNESTENKSELDIYLLEMRVNRNDPTFKILDFWKSNAARYPVLAMMARDVLAIPVSTVASESAFSAGGRVLDPFCSSLTPKTVEALICVQDWLQTTHGPLYLEERLEELEKIEAEVSSLTDEIHLVNLEE